MPSVQGVSQSGEVGQFVNSRDSWEIPGRTYNPASQDRSGGLGGYVSVNGSLVLDKGQQLTLQSVAFSVSSVSLVAAFLAIYWFCMMRRSFRRDLVLLLIAGGTWKSLWFVLFGAVEFTYGHVSPDGAFCRVSGYMLEVSFEACDLAILFMSVHLCLQIFPSTRTSLTHDGLYPFRHTVFALWLILPNVAASLAFINPQDPYTVAGGFCFLPLRPIWYRLALFWIPRYLIWIFIMYVALRIYLHVGSEFKIFGLGRDDEESLAIPGMSTVRRRETREMAPGPWNEAAEELTEFSFGGVARTDLARDDYSNAVDMGPPPSEGSPTSTKPLNPTVVPPVKKPSKAFRPPGNTKGSSDTPQAAVHDGSHHSHTSRSSHNPANAALEQRRQAIQRQLRLLFIYPCIYMIMWVIPSISHFMSYSNYWAQHPVFVLSILQVICLTLMTLVDVLVFSLRERPWRQIPGADGTFISSLYWWRIVLKHEWRLTRKASTAYSTMTDWGRHDKIPNYSYSASRSNPFPHHWLHKLSFGRSRDAKNDQPTLPGLDCQQQQRHQQQKNTRSLSVIRKALPRHKAGRSDRQQLDIDRAYERLALERAEYEAEYRAMQLQRRNSGFHIFGLGERQWFDHECFAMTDGEPGLSNMRSERRSES